MLVARRDAILDVHQRRAGSVQVKVHLQIPFVGGIEGTWKPERVERDAAWELYVELVTRISVVELHRDDGRAREALSSFYQFFAITRDILRRYGPAVARGSASRITFGRIAVSMLNGVIRPVLAHWHPRLTAYEETRPAEIDSVSHEQGWEHIAELRAEIDRTRHVLTDIAQLLGTVAGVESLLPETLHLPEPRKTAGGGTRRMTFGREHRRDGARPSTFAAFGSRAMPAIAANSRILSTAG